MMGIPTMYKGVRFRSRLEATWAAYFDDNGIEWEYEPLDLAGYIPDFIAGERGRPKATLIEIKPVLDPDALWEHTDKIDKSGWKGEAMIFGAAYPLCPPAVHYGLIRPSGGEWGMDKGLPAVNPPSPVLIEYLRECWAEAKNKVQWKAPR